MANENSNNDMSNQSQNDNESRPHDNDLSQATTSSNADSSFLEDELRGTGKIRNSTLIPNSTFIPKYYQEMSFCNKSIVLFIFDFDF